MIITQSHINKEFKAAKKEIRKQHKGQKVRFEDWALNTQTLSGWPMLYVRFTVGGSLREEAIEFTHNVTL